MNPMPSSKPLSGAKSLALHNEFNPSDRHCGISVDGSQVARSERRQFPAPSQVDNFYMQNARRKCDCPRSLGDGAATGNGPGEQRTLLRRRQMKALGNDCFQPRSSTFHRSFSKSEKQSEEQIVALDN